MFTDFGSLLLFRFFAPGEIGVMKVTVLSSGVQCVTSHLALSTHCKGLVPCS